MSSKQQRYSQPAVHLGLQRTLLDVAESIRQLQKDNNPNVIFQKALDFILRIAPLLLLFGVIVAFTTGIAYALKSIL